MHMLGYTKWEYWSLTITKRVQCLQWSQTDSSLSTNSVISASLPWASPERTPSCTSTAASSPSILGWSQRPLQSRRCAALSSRRPWTSTRRWPRPSCRLPSSSTTSSTSGTSPIFSRLGLCFCLLSGSFWQRASLTSNCFCFLIPGYFSMIFFTLMWQQDGKPKKTTQTRCFYHKLNKEKMVMIVKIRSIAC